MLNLEDIRAAIESDEDLLQAFSSLGVSNPVARILRNIEDKKEEPDVVWKPTNTHRGVTLSDHLFFPHQIYLIEKILQRECRPFMGMSGGIVPLEMGLGKTLIGVSVVAITNEKTLYLCEKTLLRNVIEDVVKFFPTMKLSVVLSDGGIFGSKPSESLMTIMSYDTLVGMVGRTKKFGDMIDTYTDYKRIIADESHTLSPKTKRFQAIEYFPSGKRLCMTGTPGGPKKLFAQLKFCGLEGFDDPKTWDAINFESAYLSKCVFEIGEKSNIKMKSVKHIELPLTFATQVERDTYNILRKKAEHSRELNAQKLMKTTECKKIEKCLSKCCTASFLCSEFIVNENMGTDEYRIWSGDKSGTAGFESTKLNAIKNIIKSLPPNDKYIVFSTNLDILKIAYESNPAQTVLLTGSVRKSDDVIASFKSGNARGLYASAVGSVGLNLTEANHVIFVTPELDDTVRRQIIARCQRIGQKKNVYVYHIFIAGSIEAVHRDMNEGRYDISSAFGSNGFDANVFRQLVSS